MVSTEQCSAIRQCCKDDAAYTQLMQILESQGDSPLSEAYMSQTGDVFVMYDPMLRYRYINPVGASIMGRRPEQIIGRTPQDVFGAGAQSVEPFVRKALESRRNVNASHAVTQGAAKRFYDAIYTPVLGPNQQVTSIVGVFRDVTRYRAHIQQIESDAQSKLKPLEDSVAAVTRQRDFFGSILDATSAYVAVLDGRGRIIRCNRACERRTGLRAEEAKGRPLLELLEPARANRPFSDVLKSVRDGDLAVPFQCPWRADAPDNATVAWQLDPVLGVDGAVNFIVATGIDAPRAAGQDTTDVSSAPAAADKNFFENIADAADALLLVLDPDGRIVYSNLAYREFSGKTRDKVDGRLFADVARGAEDAGALDRVYRSLDAGNYPVVYDAIIEDADRKPRSIAWSFTVLWNDDGAVQFRVAIGRDTTNLRQLQAERDQLAALVAGNETAARRRMHEFNEKLATLRREREFLSLLIDRTPVLCASLDLDGRINVANQAFQTNTGIDLEHADRPSFEDLTRATDKTRTWSEIVSELRGGRPDAFSESTLPGSSAPDATIDWTFSPILDENGRLTGVVVSGVDATARVKIQKESEELAAMIANKEHALSHRTKDMNEAIGVVEFERNRLLDILDRTAAGVVVLDAHGKIIQANAYAEEFLGRSAAKASGASLDSLIHAPVDTVTISDLLDRALTLEGSVSAVLLNDAKPDGAALWSFRGCVQGEDPFIVATAIDYSPVYAAREEAKASAQRLVEMDLELDAQRRLVSEAESRTNTLLDDERSKAQEQLDAVSLSVQEAETTFNTRLEQAQKTFADEKRALAKEIGDIEKDLDTISTVLENTSVFVVAATPDGKVFCQNRECQRVTGRSLEDIDGKHFSDILSSDERKKVDAVLRRIRKGDERVEHEFPWMTRGGEQRLVSWSFRAAKNAEGTLQYIVITGIDVTDVARAGKEKEHLATRLTASESAYQARIAELTDLLETRERERALLMDVFQAMPVFTAAIDAKGVPLRVNKAFDTVLDRSRRDALEKPISSLFTDPDAAGRLHDAIEEALEVKGCTSFEAEWSDLQQRRRVVAWRVAALPPTELYPAAFALTGEDVTERRAQQTDIDQRLRIESDAHETLQKRFEEQLRALSSAERERDHLKGVLESAGLIYVMLDMDGRILAFNSAAEMASGHQASKVKNKYFSILFPDIDADAMLREDLDKLSREDQSIAKEREWLDRAGQRRAISWTYSKLTTPDGGPCVVAVGTDITDARSREAGLASTLTQKEQQFEARIAQLANDLEQRTNQRDLMAAVLDAVPAPLLVVDGAGNLSSVNRAGQTITARPLKEVMGSPLNALFPDDDSEPRIAEVMDRARKEDGPVFTRIPLSNAQGQPRTFSWAFSAVDSANEKVKGHLIVLGEDLTDRLRLETEHAAFVAQAGETAHHLEDSIAQLEKHVAKTSRQVEFLTAAFDAADAPLAIIVDGRIDRVNPAMQKLIAPAAIAPGDTFDSFFKDDSSERVRAAIADARTKTSTIELSIAADGDTTRQIEWVFTPTPAPGGHIVIAAQDRTLARALEIERDALSRQLQSSEAACKLALEEIEIQRRLSEDQREDTQRQLVSAQESSQSEIDRLGLAVANLERERDLLETIIRHVQTPVLVLDENDNVRHISDACGRLVFREPEEVTNASFIDVFAGTGAEESMRTLINAAEMHTAPTPVQVSIVTPKGGVKQVEWRLQTRTDGPQAYRILTGIDRTELQQTLKGFEELKTDLERIDDEHAREVNDLNATIGATDKERAFLAGLLDAQHAPVAAMDADGLMVYANAFFRKLTGINAHEIEGAPFGKAMADGEQPKDLLESARATLADGELRHVEVPLTSTDGVARQVLWRIGRFQPLESLLSYVVATATDVSQLRAREADIQQLENRIQAIEQDLARAHRQRDSWIQVFERASIPMLLLGEDSAIVRSNDASARTAGISASELEGRPFIELLHDAEPEALARVTAEVLHSGDAVANEWRLRKADSGTTPTVWTFCALESVDSDIDAAILAVGDDVGPLRRLQSEQEELIAQYDDEIRQFEAQIADLQAALSEANREREFLAHVVNELPVSVAVMTNEGAIERVNRTCELACGRSARQLLEMSFAELFTGEEDRDHISKALTSLKESEQSESFEAIWKPSKNRERRHAWQLCRLTSNGDEPPFYLATGADVTEWRHAERERDRFRVIVEHVDEAICVVNDENEVMYLNPAASEMFAVAGGKPVKKRILADLLAGQAGFFREAALKPAFAGESWTGEHAFAPDDQTRRLFAAKSFPLSDGIETLAGICFRDVTSEREAKLQRNLFRAAANCTREAILIAEGAADWESQRVIYSNPAFMDVTGHAEDDLVGGAPVAVFGRAAVESVENGLSAHVARAAVYEGELEACRKSGDEFLCRVKAAPVQTDRAHGHWVYTLEDISSIREQTAALRAHQAFTALVRDHLPSGFWATDANLRIAIVEGAPPTEDDRSADTWLGMQVDEAIAPVDEGRAIEDAHIQALDGVSASISVSHQNRIFEMHILPLFDANATVAGVAGFSIDVSGNVKNERLRLAAEARYNALYGALQDGVILLDDSNAVCAANSAAEGIFGRSDLVGQDIAALLGESGWRDDLMPAIDHIGPEPIARTIELVGWNAAGEAISLEVNYARFESESGSRVALIVRDVTARKRLENDLAVSEALRQTVLDHVDEAVLVVDPAGAVVEANRSAAARFRLEDNPATEIAFASLFARPHDWDMQQAFAAPDGLRDAGLLDTPLEFVGRAGDEGFPMGLLLTDRVRSVAHAYVAIIQDLTQRKASAAEIFHLSDELAKFGMLVNQLHRVVTARHQTLDTALRDILRTGCDMFDLHMGVVGHVNGSEYTILASHPENADLAPTVTYPLEDLYCHDVVLGDQTVSHRCVSENPAMAAHPMRTRHGMESYFGAPIHVGERVHGALSFYSAQPRATGFSALEIELLELMAQSAGLLIAAHAAERGLSVSQAELIEMRRAELLLGSRMQQLLLESAPPENTTGVGMAAWLAPATQIDGDFYDFVEHDEFAADVIFGDLAGDGVRATLAAVVMKTALLRALGDLKAAAGISGLPRPEAVVARALDAVGTHLGELNARINLCYVRVDLNQARIDYVACGHNAMLHLRRGAGRVDVVASDSPAVPLEGGASISQTTVAIEEGDVILLYSAGVDCAQSATGEAFGSDRLADIVRNHPDLEADVLTELIREKVESFAGPQSSDNDRTCVVLRVRSLAAGRSLYRRQQTLSSDLSELARIRSMLEDLLEHAPGAGDIHAPVLDAVSEVASSIMIDSYGGRADGVIEFDAEVSPEQVRVRLSHWGDANGEHILSAPMDEVNRTTDAHGRHTVSLVKYY